MRNLHFKSKTSFWGDSKFWNCDIVIKKISNFDISKFHVFQNFVFSSIFDQKSHIWNRNFLKINFRLNWHVKYEKFHKIVIFVHFWPRISFLKFEILWNISWWVSMMSSDWSIMNYVALVWLLTLFGLTIIPKHEIAKVSLVSGSEKIEITKKNDSRINENNDFKLNKFRLYIISI